MSLWKQLVLTVVIAVAAVVGWGAVDPTARARLLSLGVPATLLPEPMFLAKANEMPGGADAGAPRDQAASAGPGGQARVGAGGPGRAANGLGGNTGQGGGGRGPGGPVLVVTDAAKLATTNDHVSAIGTGAAVRAVTLFPRTAGMVSSVEFRPGEQVEAGAVLVRLDDDVERIALEQAQLNLDDARAKVDRYERLVTSKAISSVDRDTARTELSTAELGVREARLALERRRVLAPFAGTVGLTAVEVGDMVAATTEIATLDDRSTLKVEFRVPESAASKVALGQAVTATTPSRPGEAFEGNVSAVGSRIEIDSRTLVVQADIPNRGDVLRPGMSFLVELRFPGDTHMEVPALSLQWDRDGSFVWRVVDGKAERVPVTIIQRNASTVLVDGGIIEGDVVVVEGVQRLRPGSSVALAGDPPAVDPAIPPPRG